MQTSRPWWASVATTVATLLTGIWLVACDGQKPEPVKSSVEPASKLVEAAPPVEPSYQAARYDKIHFKPAIEKATDAECLACHQEVLKPSVRKHSPAGLASADAKAWYQLSSTYTGEQDTMHRRHIETPLAKQLMNLRCITCHQGNDPRDEAPGTSASNQNQDLTLRKSVSAEAVCLKCHGKMNWQVMGLPQAWEQSKTTFQNNCLLCHAAIRTTRHRVTYLNAKAIEEAGAKSGDACYGCHGGRAWYRLTYPYPRHAWPTMAPEIPAWAKHRPTESEARFLPAAVAQGTKP
jgi:hypothetical protein